MDNKAAPNALYKDAKAPVTDRADDLIGRMTLEEKAAQLGSYWIYQLCDKKGFSEAVADGLMNHGLGQVTRIGGASTMTPVECAHTANQVQKYLIEKTRMGIPAIIHEEACSGLLARGSTVFPQTLGVSCTWNPELAEEMGCVIREQMRAAGMHQALAPLMDVTRDPRWGRVEETYGEDPYLVSRMSTAFVKGLQGDDLTKGVIATGKHFVGYGLSEGGMNWAPAHIPAREMREVFLAPFEAAVKEAGLASIMPGYHELDGILCHANRELLQDILREEWGFDGIVVSDYFAIAQLYNYHNITGNRAESVKLALEAGLDMELPHTDCCGNVLVEGVKNGQIDVNIIDRAVLRVLTMKLRLGLFENPYVDESQTQSRFDTPAHRETARRIARESLVLLKNESNLLPLRKDLKSIAVIGPNADNIRNMLGDYTYPAHIESLIEVKETENTLDQPVPENVDTDTIHMPEMISFLSAIKEKVSAGTEVNYAKGCEVLSDYREGFAEAMEAARKSEVALIFVGDKSGLFADCSTGETRDRAVLTLPGEQEALVRAVAGTGTPVVLVLVNGRPFSLEWEQENIPAILEAWLPGAQGATAVADVLFGDYSPGGKLTISFPRTVGQIPVYYNHKISGGRSHWKGDYVETSTKPLYPFGYGLSYTEFRYNDFSINKTECDIDEYVEIGVTITNAGKMKGDEIVQLYVNDAQASVTRPVLELKGFKRVALEAGQSRRVTFTLSPKQLGFYDIGMNFVVEPGDIHVLIGRSSNRIEAEGSFRITGDITRLDKKVFFSAARVD